MTNWMTAAGIAFIAGGIATLICLRSVLFGRAKPEGRRAKPEGRRAKLEGRRAKPEGRREQAEGRREQPEGRQKQLEGRQKQLEGRQKQRESRPKQVEAAPKALESGPRRGSSPRDGTGSRPRRPSLGEAARAEPAPAEAAPAEAGDVDRPAARRASWAERDRPEPRRPDTPRQNRRHASGDDDLPGGLASIGLGDDAEEAEVEIFPVVPAYRAAPDEPEPDPLVVTPGDEESRPIPVRGVDRSDPAYGSRVDGWIRPEYHDDPAESPSGEYWTPVPMEGLDLPEDDPEPSARGYGWPIPVERLPPVPDYEPATGFDLTPVATEPTELVPTWPPVPGERRRRSDKRRRRLEEHLEEVPVERLEGPGGLADERQVRLPGSWTGRDTKPADNRFLENEPRRLRPDEADQRFRAPTGEPERRRPRPRPRPAVPPDNVYVSRHAADPPR